MTELLNSYTWNTVLVHFICAAVIFFVVNWLGKQALSVGYMQISVIIKDDTAPAFNFIFKIIAPVVLYVFLIVGFQQTGHAELINNSYLIIIFFGLIRLAWIVATSRTSLTNWGAFCLFWGCSVGLTFWIYSLVEQVEQILPNPRALLDQFWILIIVFVYSIFNKLQISRKSTEKRKARYISSRYKFFKKKYDHIIKGYFDNEFYEALTYSIMICEDFNRPKIVRWIEYARFFLTKRKHTLGIMQITTDKYISNADSVKLAVRKIAADNNRIISSSKEGYYNSWVMGLVMRIAQEYNGGAKYSSEVESIYEYISGRYYQNILTEFTIIEK